MKHNILIPLLLVLAFVSSGAFAAEGKVVIKSVSPSSVYANDKITLSYEATPGPEGDHLHLNVDGKRVDVIHQLKGNAVVDPLPEANIIFVSQSTPKLMFRQGSKVVLMSMYGNRASPNREVRVASMHERKNISSDC